MVNRLYAFVGRHYGSRETNSWAPPIVWWSLLAVSYWVLGWTGVAFVWIALLLGAWGALWNAIVRGKLVP